ncbi:putative powdery mildew resistance protein, RPW8 [Helianthus annuus]|nr:putative powdery mildew resistance protein, RPW8 [Helianthus annuus]
MEKLNKQLDRPKEETEFLNQLKQAEDLVRKCEDINLKFLKKSTYASNLEEMNRFLQKYVASDLQLQNASNGAETLVEMRSLKKRLEEGSSSGWSSAVPPEKCVAIGFDDPLRDLKLMVLEDSLDRGCPVVVVSGAGGCGKTTRITKPCHDPHIKVDHVYHTSFVSKFYCDMSK